MYRLWKFKCALKKSLLHNQLFLCTVGINWQTFYWSPNYAFLNRGEIKINVCKFSFSFPLLLNLLLTFHVSEKTVCLRMLESGFCIVSFAMLNCKCVSECPER